MSASAEVGVWAPTALAGSLRDGRRRTHGAKVNPTCASLRVCQDFVPPARQKTGREHPAYGTVTVHALYAEDARSGFTNVTWRQGSNGATTSRFNVLTVRPATKQCLAVGRRSRWMARLERLLRQRCQQWPLGLEVLVRERDRTSMRGLIPLTLRIGASPIAYATAAFQVGPSHPRQTGPSSMC